LKKTLDKEEKVLHDLHPETAKAEEYELVFDVIVKINSDAEEAYEKA